MDILKTLDGELTRLNTMLAPYRDALEAPQTISDLFATDEERVKVQLVMARTLQTLTLLLHKMTLKQLDEDQKTASEMEIQRMTTYTRKLFPLPVSPPAKVNLPAANRMIRSALTETK